MTPLNAHDGARYPTGRFPVAFDRVAAFQGLQVSRTEGEDHERLRRIAHRAFTPSRIADMRAMIQGHCNALLDPLEGEDECDLMPFAYRFPLMVIADILSVPAPS